MVTPVGNDVATTWDALLAGTQRRRRNHAVRRERLPRAHRRRGEGVPRRGRRCTAQDAQAREPLASLRARRRRAGVCATPASGRPPATAARWGCAVGAGDDDERLQRARRDARAQRVAEATSTAALLLSDPAANDPLVFCRSQASAGLALADALLRHPRLRDGRAHGVRVGRTSARHRAQADPPRRGRLRARRRLRFDGQPDRHLGLLPALRAVARQRRRRNARAARSISRATASCWARARAFSCSRNGKQRAAAARGSMPSSPATATRCRATGSPIRRPMATARSRRCAPRSPTRGAAPDGRRLSQRPRHVDAE